MRATPNGVSPLRITGKTVAGKDNLKPFAKGKSGNPGGRPKLDVHVRELARSHTQEALETLVSVMRDSKSPPSARVAASSTIIDRGWGRAPQTVDVNFLNQLSDGDLDKRIAQIIAGGLATGSEAGALGAASGEAAPTEH